MHDEEYPIEVEVRKYIDLLDVYAQGVKLELNYNEIIFTCNYNGIPYESGKGLSYAEYTRRLDTTAKQIYTPGTKLTISLELSDITGHHTEAIPIKNNTKNIKEMGGYLIWEITGEIKQILDNKSVLIDCGIPIIAFYRVGMTVGSNWQWQGELKAYDNNMIENLSTRIIINPTQEEIITLLDIYEEGEKILATDNVKKRFNILNFITSTLLVIIALPLTILRIPFVIIRKARLSYLKAIEKRHFKKRTKWDPDMAGREFHYKEPSSQSAAEFKLLEKNRNENRKLINNLKSEWLIDPTDFNKLIDYAISESTYDYYLGSRLALYILHQLKEMPYNSNIKYGLLYWNMSVIAFRLRLTNNAKQLEKMAIGKGFNPKPSKKLTIKHIVRYSFAGLAWNKLRNDIILCWPR